MPTALAQGTLRTAKKSRSSPKNKPRTSPSVTNLAARQAGIAASANLAATSATAAQAGISSQYLPGPLVHPRPSHEPCLSASMHDPLRDPRSRSQDRSISPQPANPSPEMPMLASLSEPFDMPQATTELTPPARALGHPNLRRSHLQVSRTPAVTTLPRTTQNPQAPNKPSFTPLPQPHPIVPVTHHPSHPSAHPTRPRSSSWTPSHPLHNINADRPAGLGEIHSKIHTLFRRLSERSRSGSRSQSTQPLSSHTSPSATATASACSPARQPQRSRPRRPSPHPRTSPRKSTGSPDPSRFWGMFRTSQDAKHERRRAEAIRAAYARRSEEGQSSRVSGGRPALGQRPNTTDGVRPSAGGLLPGLRSEGQDGEKERKRSFRERMMGRALPAEAKLPEARPGWEKRLEEVKQHKKIERKGKVKNFALRKADISAPLGGDERVFVVESWVPKHHTHFKTPPQQTVGEEMVHPAFRAEQRPETVCTTFTEMIAASALAERQRPPIALPSRDVSEQHASATHARLVQGPERSVTQIAGPDFASAQAYSPKPVLCHRRHLSGISTLSKLHSARRDSAHSDLSFTCQGLEQNNAAEGISAERDDEQLQSTWVQRPMRCLGCGVNNGREGTGLCSMCDACFRQAGVASQRASMISNKGEHVEPWKNRPDVTRALGPPIVFSAAGGRERPKVDGDSPSSRSTRARKTLTTYTDPGNPFDDLLAESMADTKASTETLRGTTRTAAADCEGSRAQSVWPSAPPPVPDKDETVKLWRKSSLANRSRAAKRLRDRVEVARQMARKELEGVYEVATPVTRDFSRDTKFYEFYDEILKTPRTPQSQIF